jgi:hypothetical protein
VLIISATPKAPAILVKRFIYSSHMGHVPVIPGIACPGRVGAGLSTP